ncbi:MAG TPA: hypothetical protein VLJ17_10520 [Xanthobacteraceae bacterium]|nr:hypothetical protein [Xanthobacteraceae bacterium]
MSSLNAAGRRTNAVPAQSASFILPFFLPGKVVGTILGIAPDCFLKTEPGEYVAYFVALCPAGVMVAASLARCVDSRAADSI